MYFKDALKKANDLKIKRTMDALEKNNINAYYAKSIEEAQEIFKSLIEEGSVITAGGSMTAVEAGLVEILRNGNYNYIDREREGITKEVTNSYK